MRTPILFLVFNRPDTTRDVFQAIRAARPPRLYIAADGARPDRSGERERSEEVRRTATAVDWPCEVRTLFRDRNLGCKLAVSGGISWFFEQEEEGIILEDDVLPDASFFPFCEELLDRYRFNPEIMMVSGDYFRGVDPGARASYFFSRYTHIWGWASWRRAWSRYDRDMKQWPALRNTDFLARVCDGDPGCSRHWTAAFDAVHAGQIDTWDYQWLFCSFVNSGLSVLPTRNLVRNIGFTGEATHTTDAAAWVGRLPVHSMDFPLRHPEGIKRDAASDRWVERNVFGSNQSLFGRVRRRISGLPVIGSTLRKLLLQ